MGVQTIVTDSGEELIVLSRRDYDALLAALGDEEAEDRATIRIADEAQAALDRGDAFVMPAGFVERMLLDGDTRVRAARLYVGQELDHLSARSLVDAARLELLDQGKDAPTPDERDRIAAALRVDPRWLED